MLQHLTPVQPIKLTSALPVCGEDVHVQLPTKITTNEQEDTSEHKPTSRVPPPNTPDGS